MGHLPIELSLIAAHFIQKGHRGKISCQATRKRIHLQGPQVGMTIPWSEHVWKLDKLISAEKRRILQRYGLVWCNLDDVLQ